MSASAHAGPPSAPRRLENPGHARSNPVHSAPSVEEPMSKSTATGLQLRSTVKPEGVLELSLVDIPTPDPGPDDVVVRVEASPLNPSDLGLLLAAADPATLKVGGTADRPVATATIPPEVMRGLTARVGQSLPVGNEGAGTVVAAGSSAAAQALIGKTVSIIGGAMYTQYRTVPVSQAQPLPAGTTAAEGAS